MIDREKVIKGLGSCVEYFTSKVKGVMFDEWVEESRKAIALLKAQEPMEPGNAGTVNIRLSINSYLAIMFYSMSSTTIARSVEGR